MGFFPSMSWLSGDLRNNSRRCLLYISSQRRIIGLCIMEKISEAFPLLLDSSKPFKQQRETLGDNANPSTPLCLERSNDSCPASLGIYQIWCHSKYRRAGISRRMVDAARSSAYFGLSVPLSHLAFSTTASLLHETIVVATRLYWFMTSECSVDNHVFDHWRQYIYSNLWTVTRGNDDSSVEKMYLYK